MADHVDLPFKAEYAKSNRASCKGCSGLISKETLRLALMVQSPVFDGKVPNWFHFNCFWKRARVTNYADIAGFDSLRWDDQEKIKTKVASGGSSGGTTDGDEIYKDFALEYAKSNRSKCRGCENKIEKDNVRASKKDYETQRAKMYGPQDLWHHIDCFAQNRDELGFDETMDPTKIKGFKILKKEDRESILEKWGKGEKKKRKTEEKTEQALKKQKTESQEELALREQSKLLWSIRDALSKDVSNEALKCLLEFNGQDIPAGESRLLDRVSDIMAFGVLQPCTECKGQLTYSQGGYRCTGSITEWTKCMNTTRMPARKAFKVPKEFHDVELLKKYKYVKRERLFNKEVINKTPSLVSSASNAGESAAKDKPLEKMKFVVIGKSTKKSKAEITKVIVGLGGKVVTRVDKTTAACISTKDEVEKKSKQVLDAKAVDVHVVEEAFLDSVVKGGAVLFIKQHSICDWGSDPLDRLDVVDGPKKSFGTKSVSKKDDKYFTKSMPSKVKMTVKGGAAVDPESGLEDQAHVLSDGSDIYAVVLGLVDISRGTNSFYKLQVLESDKSKSWWVYRAWGRVGTTIGGNKLERCGSKNSAVEQFQNLYLDKTGNEWDDRKNFTKYPNKFYPIDIDYGADDEDVKKLNLSAPSNSKLPSAVQDLVKMIFDVESMKKAMLEFEIDLTKMPLGKLSKKQIENAYKVLTELNQHIENKSSTTKFLDASNRFYTLIPHDFGMTKPPLLDTADVIKKKVEMLDNLLDIEIAYNLLKSGQDGNKDPIDSHYETLNTKIEPVDKKSEEYERLVDFVKNTHASTHNQYDLVVEEIFKMDREGEKKRYRPFRDLHNRKLLWHGSRTTNYAGILSQGLRIAPPEAPVTGYMFGKGVYFADMVSKSANYCRTSKSDPTGILLLCEVALGNMYELSGAKYVDKLPKSMHSTKGCGMTTPDPSGAYVEPDGVEIPMGKGVPSGGGHTSLLYNEYIVYDVAQIQMKYLLKTNFKFKW